MRSPEELQRWLEEEIEKARGRMEQAVEMVVHRPTPQVGQTPYDVVYRENKLRLLHYHPRVKKVQPVPLLIVSPMINRYYILDLKPGRSLVEYLLERGIDVYMLDWGIPGPEDRHLTWDHFIQVYLHHCVERVAEASKGEEVSLLGYCMGGTMATMYVALHPGQIKNLINLAAPINFKDEGLLSLWTDKAYFNVDKLVDVLGNIPPELMQNAFQMLRPTGQISKMVSFFDRMHDQDFVDLFLAMEHWVNDNVPFPGEAFRKYVKDCYQENLLVQGKLRIDHQVVDLKKITCALLVIVAEKDHICPPASGAVLLDLVRSTDKELIALPGGHVGIVSGGGAYRYLWPTIGEWLSRRSGSRKPTKKKGNSGRR